MRLSDPETAHALVLYALVPLVAVLGLGFPAALGVSAVAAVAGIVVRSRRLAPSADPDAMELQTITYSHYVEKVRWCMDRLGAPYREVQSAGILGLVLGGRTVPTLVVPASRTSIGDSPAILRYLWGAWSARVEPERCRFLAPTAEALALERRFDTDLGVNVRLWSYHHLLEDRELTLKIWGIEEPSIPDWQKVLLRRFLPVLAPMLRRMLGVSAPRAAEALAATKEVFAEVDAMLADGRRYLMGGDEITFVDITFASLAALALFPEGYGGRAVAIREAPLDSMPAEWRREVDELRDTAAGRFVHRLYAEERLS